MHTAAHVSALSYPDFVAFIGQPNTPPGAQRTLDDWTQMARIDAAAHVLDLACTTGYSSRTLARQTGCSAAGIDLSAAAIELAIAEAERARLSARLSYRVADAASLPFGERTFSHVVAGGVFGFIQERSTALAECARVLVPAGKLCVSSFYYREPPPDAFLDQVEAAIGYRPDPARTYEYWQRFFAERFEPAGQRPYELDVLSEQVVTTAVRAFVFEQSEPLRGQPDEVREACFERLLAVRLVLNQHRRYQGLSVAVWQSR